MFNFIRNMYRLGKMTAEQVWAAVDKRQITRAQAIQICGPEVE